MYVIRDVQYSGCKSNNQILDLDRPFNEESTKVPLPVEIRTAGIEKKLAEKQFDFFNFTLTSQFMMVPLGIIC